MSATDVFVRILLAVTGISVAVNSFFLALFVREVLALAKVQGWHGTRLTLLERKAKLPTPPREAT